MVMNILNYFTETFDFGFSKILTWVCGGELFLGTLWSLFLSARAYFGGADEKSLSLCSSASSASSSSLERSSEAPYGGLLREFCKVHRISINTNMNVHNSSKIAVLRKVFYQSLLWSVEPVVVFKLMGFEFYYPSPSAALILRPLCFSTLPLSMNKHQK